MELPLGLLTDIALLLLLILQTWLGFRRGLLWQAAALAAIGFGIVIGTACAPALGAHLIGVVTGEPFHAHLIAFLFIAGLLGFALRMLAVWAEVQSEQGLSPKQVEARRAKDRVLGGVFGALKACVLAAIVAAAGVTLWPQARCWEGSRLTPPLAHAGAKVLPDGAAEEATAWVRQLAERNLTPSPAATHATSHHP